MKYLLFLLTLISLTAFGQDTTKHILVNKDTLLTITTTTNQTGTVTYTYPVVSVNQVIRPFKIPPVDPPPVTPGKIYGFGSQAVGGSSSTTVYRVTNTNTSGAGSLRAGLGSNKTILFEIDGTFGCINLTNISYLTIGANGKDVTIAGGGCSDGIYVGRSHHIIFDGLRVRDFSRDGIGIVDGSNNVAVVNCSVYGNGDGDIDAAGGTGTAYVYNVTIQRCILGPVKGSSSGPELVTGNLVSDYLNLYYTLGSTGNAERQPYAHRNYSPKTPDPCVDHGNNLHWHWNRYASSTDYGATANFRNSYYYKPSAPTANPFEIGHNSPAKAYVSGNVSGGGGNINSSTEATAYVIPEWAQLPLVDACTAAREVLKTVGPAKKNATEQGWINSITLNCP